MVHESKVGLAMLLAAAAIGAVLAVAFVPLLDTRYATDDLAALRPAHRTAAPGPASRPAEMTRLGVQQLGYFPPRPQDAPPEMRPAVLLGQRIMDHTRDATARFAGNALSCSDCHFNAGLSPPGRNSGVPLVGVAALRPLSSPSGRETVDLAGQVNRCFVDSLNGRPLPTDSSEMAALLAYLRWISRGIRTQAEAPWLGVRPLAAARAPSVIAGAAVFAVRCSVCHGPAGAGTQFGPPLWGEQSFTSASPMAAGPVLAAFAHLNMPREDPVLKPAEAMDVAAYILAQARPHGGR